MILFCSDLDNTLIYSYKRDIGEHKICVETYNEKALSFMTKNSFEKLRQLVNSVYGENRLKKFIFIPVTTRTVEQYKRINFGFVPEYALVCNGGILLKNGEIDEKWLLNSLKMTEQCEKELRTAEAILENDKNVYFEVRNINELFIFTKSSFPEQTVLNLKEHLDLNKVGVFENGEKVYVVPNVLNKGNAIKRLENFFDDGYVVSAGDSDFDLPMLMEAHLSFIPKNLYMEKKVDLKYKIENKSMFVFEKGIFSDVIFERVEKLI